jgi:hypothetical protein
VALPQLRSILWQHGSQVSPAIAALPANLKAKGWSDARAFAATQLKKNPNSYFYRHVAPHQVQVRGAAAGPCGEQPWMTTALTAKGVFFCPLCSPTTLSCVVRRFGGVDACVWGVRWQAQGEWTDEEHELFLSTARAHGVGDKWGLFASYLPQVP